VVKNGSVAENYEIDRLEPKLGLNAANSRKKVQGFTILNCVAGDTISVTGFDADGVSSITPTRITITRVGN
jgi:hypothetical protein